MGPGLLVDACGDRLRQGQGQCWRAERGRRWSHRWTPSSPGSAPAHRRGCSSGRRAAMLTTRLRALRHRLALRGPTAGPSGTPTYPTCVHAGLSPRAPRLAGIPGRDRRTPGAVSRSVVRARGTRCPARSRVTWQCPAVCLRSNSSRGHRANRRASIRMQEVIVQLSWDDSVFRSAGHERLPLSAGWICHRRAAYMHLFAVDSA